MLNISKFSDIQKTKIKMFYNYENYENFENIISFSNFEHFESYIYIQYIYIFLDFYKKKIKI